MASAPDTKTRKPRYRAIQRDSVADLRAQAEEALRAEPGCDFGPLSHAERNRLIFGI